MNPKKITEAIERGRYGRCFGCDEVIDEKRLVAIPWATTCLRCEEHTEAEHRSPRMAAGMEIDET
jgi:RNA polymerase-binding transcription factor DksA